MSIIKEFRIGNLVADYETEPHYFAIEEIGLYEDGELAVWYRNGSIMHKDPDLIPLTEEWLLKAGAEAYEFDHKPSQYRIGDRLIVVRDGCFYEYGTNLKLEFVHRFQNLFFELQNGKELEFKL